MSGDARITGRIDIEPPIPWNELRRAEYATTGRWEPHGAPMVSYQDARIEVREGGVNTDQGVIMTYLGVSIVVTGGETSARTLVADVQRVVDTFGEGRTFTGYFDILYPGYGELARVVVLDGQAVKLRPAILFPGDPTTLELIAAYLRNAGVIGPGGAPARAVELLDELTRKANHG